MSGPTPEPRVRSNLNPVAEEFVPRPPGWLNQGWALGQFLLQQMSQLLLTWPQEVGVFRGPALAVDPMYGSALGLGLSSNMTPAGGDFWGPAEGCGPHAWS